MSIEEESQARLHARTGSRGYNRCNATHATTPGQANSLAVDKLRPRTAGDRIQCRMRAQFFTDLRPRTDFKSCANVVNQLEGLPRPAAGNWAPPFDTANKAQLPAIL